MEIYNENVYDLLCNTEEPLRLRMGEDERTYVEGLTERDVHSVADVTSVLEEGDKNRSGN